MPMHNSTATDQRLILLYLVNRMPYGLKHEEILGLNLDHAWMLYFDLEQQLLDLCSIGLLTRQDHGQDRYYSITAAGMEVVELYRRRIPLSIRTEIDTYVQLHADTIAKQMEIDARYEQNSAVDYTVHLCLQDHFHPMLQLQINAPNEAYARQLCDTFRQKAPLLYAQMINTLMEEDT